MGWKTGLLLFAACWALQILGTALQMRHYRTVLAGLEARWNDGFIGSGSARARFGRGAIMILVVSPSGVIRDALVMRGRTVWAKFRPLPGLTGIDVGTDPDRATAACADGRLALACKQCLAQIDKARAARPLAA